ncbi:MAG: redox-sensing transcriptional repressor Rex [Ignavibacteriales bacterium]|nr:MAG: redox-sensing transcriptional repressor Rex [Ignavibacteriales bacterium]
MISGLKPIPEPALRRLPVYLQLLKSLQERNINEVSTTVFADTLNLDPTQVRKDIAYTGMIGKPKVGYDVNELIDTIESYLNWNNLTDAFLAGTGNLGSAILGYDALKKYGINIVAAFDNDPAKIETKIQGIEVLPIRKLTNLAERMHIKVGILTVPAQAAQEVAAHMVDGGIIAIWNFAPVSLSVPKDIIVENAGFSTSLAVLSRKLTEKITHSNRSGEKIL